MKLSIIVAASDNRVIGKNNRMLWNLPEDMRFFKNSTWGSPIIMGRKTFEALGNKPLAGRFNIVISRQPDYTTGNPDVQIAENLVHAIGLAKRTDAKEIFIGGGGQIYAESITICDNIYMTRVHAVLEGDAFFPDIPENIFQLTYSRKVPADEKHAYDMDFQTWTKIVSIPEQTD